MPATRPSTRVQRRAQPFAPSRRSSRSRVSSTAVTGPNEANTGATATATTATAATASGNQKLSASSIQNIESAVSSAVVASLLSVQDGAQKNPLGQAVQEIPLVASGEAGADVSVQGPVASALDSLTGESCQFDVASPASNILNFNSISIPIDAQVNPKLKAKIWANEFIEFGSLLNQGIGETRYHIAVSSGSVSKSHPTLSLEPTTKSRPIPHVEAWTTAFQIFVGIYTRKYPTAAPSLMKYGEVVRDLASRGADWRYYDKQFRCLRQMYPMEMPWGSTHWELCIKAQSFSNPRSKIPLGKPARSPSFVIPKGFCHKFHRGLEFHGCTYKHTCNKCNMSHPANRCNFRPFQATSSQGTPARSRAPNTSSN